MQTYYLDRIKSFEGFTAKAAPDYAQYSNGYGTRALFPGEVIDRAEAERRFTQEIADARKFVERHAGGWDEGTKAALASLTFNAGTAWANSGLGEAVRNGDIDAVKSKFVQYTYAGGKPLPGLVSRREAEVAWIGNAPAAEAGGAIAPDNLQAAQQAASAPSRPAIVTQAGDPIASARPPVQSNIVLASATAGSAGAAWETFASVSHVTATALTMLALDLELQRNIKTSEADSENRSRPA